MEFLKDIGLQEVGIAGLIVILLLREIFRFVTGILALKGKGERRSGNGNEFICPLAKRNERGTLEWFHYKRDLYSRLKKLEDKK